MRNGPSTAGDFNPDYRKFISVRFTGNVPFSESPERDRLLIRPVLGGSGEYLNASDVTFR